MMHDAKADRAGTTANTDAGATLGGTPGKMSLSEPVKMFGGVDSSALHGDAGAGPAKGPAAAGVDAPALHGDAGSAGPAKAAAPGAAGPGAAPAPAGGAGAETARAPTSISMSGGAMESSFVSLLAGVSGDSDGDLLGGAATTTSTTTSSAANWKPNGEFKWWIRWATDGTSGWIVQKVTNTYSGTKGDGTAITNASVGAHPSYYECWPVSSTGVVTTVPGDARNVDQWERPSMGAGSKGAWSMKGEVYWTSTDPAGSGLTGGGAGNAGILLSGFSAPAGLGGCLLTRNANGAWDAAARAPVAHAGAAS